MFLEKKDFEPGFEFAIAGAVFMCLLLAGAIGFGTQGQVPTETITGQETRVYRLRAMNPPKHFYVVLQDKETGEVAQHFVSKHCNNWRKNSIGAEYSLSTNLILRTERGHERRVSRPTNLYAAFCAKYEVITKEILSTEEILR